MSGLYDLFLLLAINSLSSAGLGAGLACFDSWRQDHILNHSTSEDLVEGTEQCGQDKIMSMTNGLELGLVTCVHVGTHLGWLSPQMKIYIRHISFQNCFKN